MTLEVVERRHSEGCECQRCRPFEEGNTAAMTHGATSERQIRPLAANNRRRLLRQFGLRAGDLDPVGRAFLEHYVRLTAKVVLLDNWLDDHGLLDESGTPAPCAELYVRFHRQALSALSRLESHLEGRAPSLEQQLAELRRSA